MVNQWGKEGKWLLHCHSERKSARILKPADEGHFDEVPLGLFGV
jgi:hypothetical protein